MLPPLEEAYFNWLCAKVQRVEVPTPSLTHTRLFRQLHHTEYVWLLSNDDNRAVDGMELRTDFFRESGYESTEEFDRYGCSVFEMLIALANRAEFITDVSTHDWFWRMLENLQIEDYNDSVNWQQWDVAQVLEVFLWRTYDYLGHGGLFPLEFTQHDQTQMEIWDQLHEYLSELEN